MKFFSFLELSSYVGLLATCILTLNFILGMMISTGYKKLSYWKNLPNYIKKWNILKIHNWTAYLSLLLVLIHPLLLVLDSQTMLSILDILYPVNAPSEKWIITLGTISMYAIVVILITTQKTIKRSIGFRTWKNIHLISYGTALLFLAHGILVDPKFKNRPVDLVDAEKMIPEGCLLLIITTLVLRYRFYLQHKNINEIGKK